MQPPLTNLILLQNRFHIVKVLGQGGCGRTYLATDEQRFQEKCVIKEYFPNQSNSAASQKSRELFQREAATLYQIEHPQIPKFRALFEEDERFFFVQDLIAGKTYDLLLRDRLARSQTFTPDEVIEFLNRLLPVLEYIHQQNIIHRDISLDNIILRDRDNLPVLIDFGVVKLATEQLELAGSPYGTVVGKSGYAPIEQLKTGKVSPNSDLYALAVTAIVLLTGKSPGDLFDEMTVNWIWRDYLPKIDRQFADILDRMLSYRPQERYQSAGEVLSALQSIDPQLQFEACLATAPVGVTSAVPERAMPSKPPAPAPNHSGQIHSARDRQSLQNQSPKPNLFGWGAGIGVGVTMSVLAWMSLANSFKPAQIDRSIAATSAPNAVETLALGTTPTEVSGHIGKELVRHYTIEGSPDRMLGMSVLAGRVSAYIVHPDGIVPPGNPNLAALGNYFFPYAGKYRLEVKSTQETDFKLAITLTPRSAARQGGAPPPPLPSGADRQH